MAVVKFALLLTSLALPATVSAQSQYEGAGARQDIDCAGSSATIRGAGNTATVTGRCTALLIEGAGNRVTIDLAPRATVTIRGASNTVVYRTPDRTKPRVSIAGAGNQVSMAR
ncbi:DUF3060 domain-containing protein [Sphingomonas sp. 2R-10]|uniref:DUF3060 domain-containing protein n=1 Tax=Sphingomonas sp. 2R-10 TaxID=3045148 RepID=UPI000F7BAB51|nr:DUF3060 domain-containing protein [Sphingomonas sp. 2R-10]MDJ0278696.1 DUF3060 domain-containing protein [Sphingomonas sp. 2R-10]